MNKSALMIWGGWDGHQPDRTTAIFAKELELAGFTVEVSGNLDVLLDPDKLRNLSLLAPNWTMGQLTSEQEKAICDAVAGGVGLGGFHGGMGDAFRNSTNYQFMVGGQFVAHPDNHKDYSVEVVKRSDPIVEGIAGFKIVHSEQYYMHVDPSNEVLATTTFQSESAPWVNGTVMPVVWKRRFGQGKVFYSSLGHDASTFDNPEVKEITRRGLIWAAR